MENASDQTETNPKNLRVSSAAATVHPLQDVELSPKPEDGNILKNPESSTTRAKNKGNWVKFDDEVNEDSEGENETKNNNNNSNGIPSVDSENDTQTATVNKLSPLPPPASKYTSGDTTTRPRMPMESKQQQQQSPVTATPVQHSTVNSTSMSDINPAVLTTESTHVNLNSSIKTQQQLHQKNTTANASAAASHNTQLSHHSNNAAPGSVVSKNTPSVSIPFEAASPMRTIELSTGRIREGFANGDVIVTLLPANTKWPWITPAIFRPELVPEELMAQGLTLTVEEYVNAMETLVNDYRFTVYNICYKRILVCWILFAFTVLLTLLFSGLQGVALFSLGVGWLFLNAAAIFLCMWAKLRLARGLEKCLARVNKQLLKHKILLVLDDRGRISCHKVNLCFLYFDSTQCVSFLSEFLEHTEQNGGEAIKVGWESKLDIDVDDIVIQGSNPVRLSRKQAVAHELFLSYLQRWGKDFLRRRLDWTVQEAGVHETPRHLQSSICPCQYEEELLRNKIKMHLQHKHCCGINCMGCWI